MFSPGEPLRHRYTEQLRLQVELMGIEVDHHLERMRYPITGKPRFLAAEVH